MLGTIETGAPVTMQEKLRVREDEALRVDAGVLLNYVTQVFLALGLPDEDAAIAADVLVRADLRGVDSHGVAHIQPEGFYVPWLRRGEVNPRPQIRVVTERPATALLDGDHGVGMVVGYRGMEEAIRRARDPGMAVVCVRNSSHFGMTGYYAMMALPHDMIGLAMTHASPMVVPTFGRDALLGTNPIALAVPAGREPAFVLDMATSTVAAGKLEIAARMGVSIPEGWAADQEGNPTTDPVTGRRARRLLPLGGTRDQGSHKGYGLAAMVDILSGVLPGVGATSMLSGGERGHFFAAIRVDAFQPVDEFKAMMDRMLGNLKGSTPAGGHDRVYVAGEIEHELELERRAAGIPLHSEVVAGLRQVGEQLGVDCGFLGV